MRLITTFRVTLAHANGFSIYAMNGKTVEVDNTDAEGRLVLSGEPFPFSEHRQQLNLIIDAIYYAATEYKPHTLIDVATLTGAMVIAVGEHYSGVFSVRPPFEFVINSRSTYNALADI